MGIGAGGSDARTDQGLELARTYWTDLVRPLLDAHAPGLSRSAARVGPGSEVLGYDDAMSRDHDWGPCLQVFVSAEHVAQVRALLEHQVPREFAGLPTRFARTGQTRDRLHIDVLTVGQFARDRLGFDPRRGVTTAQWLSLTGQAALEVTAGAVFEDPSGELSALRGALAWYPDDLWHYLLACAWHYLDQELPLMARAGERGDELGSRVIAARLVDTTIHLAFLIRRTWAPYPKWRGTAFAALDLPPTLGAALAEALGAPDWRSRMDALAGALTVVAQLQADAALPAVAPACVPFWDRPFVHVNPDLVAALLSQSGTARTLPLGVGGIEQVTRSVDVLTDPAARLAWAARYSRSGTHHPLFG